MLLKKSKHIIFSIYRYQIVPISSVIQSELFDKEDIKSYQDLINKKNEIFSRIITNEKTKLRGHGYNVLSQLEYSESSDILIRMGVEKTKEVHKSDFKKEKIKDYPNIIVYFNNNPNKQLIYIQNNINAFSDSETVKNIIEKSISPKLSKYNLAIYIEQTFNENEFWDTIKKYEGKITFLKFDFVKENLASIAKTAVENLKYIQNNVNSHKTTIEFNAPKNGVLENIVPENEEIAGLLDYNKEGGASSPIIRVKKMKGNIKTTKSERTFEIEEYQGTELDLEKLIEKLKK